VASIRRLLPSGQCHHGATENAGVENAIRENCKGVKCRSGRSGSKSQTTACSSIISTLTTRSCTLVCAPTTPPPGCLFSLHAPPTSDNGTCGLRTLHSTTSRPIQLSEPFVRTDFARLAFRFPAPHTWNSLPKTVRDPLNRG